MRKSVFIIVASIICSCLQKPTDPSVMAEFGVKIDTTDALTTSAVTLAMKGISRKDCNLKGEISEVCQSEGCWLKLVNPGSEPLLVRMKDHAFKVPKDIAGRFIYLQGQAILDTTSVKSLKDYAADAGKNEAEIAAIVDPKTEIVIEAVGILLTKSNAGN